MKQLFSGDTPKYLLIFYLHMYPWFNFLFSVVFKQLFRLRALLFSVSSGRSSKCVGELADGHLQILTTAKPDTLEFATSTRRENADLVRDRYVLIIARAFPPTCGRKAGLLVWLLFRYT